MTSHITKEAFLAGLVCRTQGWRVHRAPRKAIGPGLEWRFYVGQEVGRLAQAQLGAGVGLPVGPTTTAVASTARAVGSPEATMLYEASFEWQGCVARADALRRQGDGWDLIEVKSGKSPEEADVKDEYIDDAAYSAMVAIGAGLPVRRCFLMLIRRELRLGDGLPVLEEIEVTESGAGVGAVSVNGIVSSASGASAVLPALRTQTFT